MRVAITGLGLVTPLGIGVPHAFRRLLRGDCGIRSLRSTDSTPLPEHVEPLDGLPCTIAGVVSRGSRDTGGFSASEWLLPGDEKRMAFFAQYAMAAALEALDDANWHPSAGTPSADTTGVCIGSGIGSIQDTVLNTTAFYEHGLRRVSPYFIPRILPNLAAGHVAMRFGFRGPNSAPSTACTTGLHAIGDAARLIACGEADVMVAGAAEAGIHPLAIAGFARAKSLATSYNDQPELSSRPFDRHRDGFVMGEGAGVVVLESTQHARDRGARIYAEIRGYGMSADAHHITAPPPDGHGALLAMQRALHSAGIAPGALDYINAHATSTPLGDAAENTAIRTLVGHENASRLIVSSTKGATGHLLGAAGSVEAIFTVLALHHRAVPPTLNLTEFDPPGDAFDMNYVARTSQKADIRVALSNSFGFGGTNASVCFAVPDFL